MEHMGIEPGRLQFSWISSAESTKFVEVVTQVTKSIKALGPNSNFTRNWLRWPDMLSYAEKIRKSPGACWPPAP